MKNFLHPKVSTEILDALVVGVGRIRSEVTRLDALGYGEEWHRAQRIIADRWALAMDNVASTTRIFIRKRGAFGQ
jgi:hypothetical protein